ncbi:MAG: TlpA disulfide reductase family protein [Pseudomonadota bacterium]
MRITAFFASLLAAAVLAAPAHAQVAPVVEGKTIAGQPFQLAALKGRVVMLMFWSTDCAVCRDKMAELRQNYQGWQGKPFELVLVSTDRRMQDLDDYEKLITQLVPQNQRFVQLWGGEASYRDNLGKPGTLPVTYLLDKTGRVVAQYSGRIPAEAWDKVADLL